MRVFQQGDVLIEEVAELPADAEPKEATARGFVLAEGEATGHSHRIEEIAGVKFLEKDGMFYIQTDGPFTVRHEEHNPITVPTGTYRVRRVREYDHFLEESRIVND